LWAVERGFTDPRGKSRNVDLNFVDTEVTDECKSAHYFCKKPKLAFICRENILTISTDNAKRKKVFEKVTIASNSRNM
jgi:hypothetical protein